MADMNTSYAINTKGAATVPAGAHPAIVAGVIGLGKQANKFDPTKPAQVRFILVYRIELESGETTQWCKTYSVACWPKAAFFKDCAALFTEAEIQSGQISPMLLLGRPCQTIFMAGRDESGAEKISLVAVGALPKSEANKTSVQTLRQAGTFQFDAGAGERPGLETLDKLPKWVLATVEETCPVQAPASTWTKPASSPPPQSPTAAFLAAGTKTAQPTPGEPFDDSLTDMTW